MHIVQFFTNLVEHHYVLTYVFLYLGLIFEGEVVLITTGILVHLGALDLWTALIFIFLGSLSKTFMGYYLGVLIYKRWQDVAFFKFFEKRLRLMVPRFKERPFWSIFISKFIFGAHTTVVLFSGFEKIDFKRYLKADVLATIIWAPALVGLGYFFSYTALHVSHNVGRFSLIIIGLVVLFIIVDKLVAWIYELFEEFHN